MQEVTLKERECPPLVFSFSHSFELRCDGWNFSICIGACGQGFYHIGV